MLHKIRLKIGANTIDIIYLFIYNLATDLKDADG
jgi:hypothetical protein